MTSIRTLLMAAAVTTGVAFAMPVASQAMPVSAPVKMQTAKDSNIVEVRHRKKWRKHKWRESRRWRHHRRWGRYCDPWDGCYRRHRHARRYWREPYYGYGDPYYGGYYPGYYGYGGPGFYGPGIGLHFRID